MDKFMTDIRGYDCYKQEEAYGEFTRKYTKLLKELDNYFEGADPKLVLELVDDKMCKLIRKLEPHPQTSKIRTSEEKI